MNQHGLSRKIPLPIKRVVRQRVGFGCIFDGALLTEYEHFDPEFGDCREHVAEGITLLCPSCHARKTVGRLTKQMVIEQNRQPFSLEAGHAWDTLRWAPGAQITVVIGASWFKSVAPVLTVHGVEILKVSPPGAEGGPFLLSGRFFDAGGKETLRIVDNDVEALADNWDIDQVGQSIVIRRKSREISLAIVHDPPATFRLERLNMIYKYHRLEVTRDGLLAIDMIDSPIGPHRVGTWQGRHDQASGPIGIHVPAQGGFHVGLSRPSDSDPLVHPNWTWSDK